MTDNLGLRPWDHNQDDYSPLAPEIAFALALTALSWRKPGLYLNEARSKWLLGPSLLHGWTLLTANVVLYVYICWLAFWFIRGIAKKKRYFVVGWFAGILLWPIRMFWPRSALPIKHIGTFGVGVALLAALALLLDDSESISSSTSHAG